jgi:hypothetical protein
MPPSTKEKFAIGISSALLVTGMITAFQPPTHDANQRQAQQTQKSVDDLSTEQEKEHQRMLDAGKAHADAENARSLTPEERRLPEPHLRLRIVP